MKNNILYKGIIPFAKSLLLFVCVIFVAIGLEDLGISSGSIILLFLLGVLFTVVLTGSYFWGMVSAVISVMLFNYLFTIPKYTFLIYSKSDVVLLFFFLVTALVTGAIMSKLQKQIAISEENANTAKLLYDIATGFLHVTGVDDIIIKGIEYIYEHTGLICMVTLSNENRTIKGSHYNDVADKSNFATYPIQSASEHLGALTVYRNNRIIITEQYERIFRSVAIQLGIALERDHMYHDREEIRMAMEKEKLRNTLLRAVAHDLRSPLTALSGASGLLSDDFDSLSEKDKKKLATDISEEIIWLTNLVENTLNMTRINESQMLIHKEYEVIDDIVETAVTHMEKLLRGREVTVSLPNSIVSLPMDGKLISQVIINLLDNSIKHTDEKATIRLDITLDKHNAIFSVIDTGKGIDASVKTTLFDSFITSDYGIVDGKRGIGLGLSICKAIVEAHGGTIFAEDNVPHGAKFTFTLPLE
ncbi:MAG: ATP-binding protein [Anaerovoracaceae bacterium]